MVENSLLRVFAGWHLGKFKSLLLVSLLATPMGLSQGDVLQDVPKEGHLAVLALGPKPTPQYYDPSKANKKGNGVDTPYISPDEAVLTSGLGVRLRPHLHQIPPTA